MVSNYITSSWHCDAMDCVFCFHFLHTFSLLIVAHYCDESGDEEIVQVTIISNYIVCVSQND